MSWTRYDERRGLLRIGPVWIEILVLSVMITWRNHTVMITRTMPPRIRRLW